MATTNPGLVVSNSMDNLPHGEVEAIPTFPLVAEKIVEVPTSAPVAMKYAVCPTVPAKRDEVATSAAVAGAPVILPQSRFAEICGR